MPHTTHRARTEKTSHPPARCEEVFTFLARALDKARTVILDLPPATRANVELEARLGIFCHGACPVCLCCGAL
jgi:hypothetical protein